MRILITGGAGFVGSSIALAFGENSANRVVVLDNLRRRGSELNLVRFQKAGIQFIHGDVRSYDDLKEAPGNFDLMVEASAEPSVHAGRNGSPAYVIHTNLQGTVNCLEYARRRAGLFSYLSTSRVYSIAPLRAISLKETERRFELEPEQGIPGVSRYGISEHFPIDKARSFYGTTKLASEMLIQEFVETYGTRAVINRCGVIAGPGQFGRSDQGVVSLWIAHHHFGLPLTYTGFGGYGKQVRDLLHPLDLVELIHSQLDNPHCWNGEPFNIGGGHGLSTSLMELTEMCREAVGRSVPVTGIADTQSVDVPYYVTDSRKAAATFHWQPKRGAKTIVSEIVAWIRSCEDSLRPIFLPQ